VPNTLLQPLPYPAASAPPNIPADILALAQAVEQRLPLHFASAAARTSAFTAASLSPAAHMLCYRDDAPGANKWEYYNTTAAAWRVYGDYKDSSTLTGTAASVTFSSIPTYLRVVELSVTARSDYASADYVGINLTINGVTSALYRAFNRFSTDTITFDANAPVIGASHIVSYIPGSTAFGGVFGGCSWKAVGWDSPHVGCLTYQSSGGTYDGTAGTNLSNISIGTFASNGPYTSITLTPAGGNFIAGSQFVLKGHE
jgi:hypothetical protein